MTAESDIENNKKIQEKEDKAYSVFKELAPECDEDMVVCMVRYSYDMKKATFYFKCEHRVDFRELVRKLASKLDVSVEMRQIGERESASLVGGIGPCGCELCCCKNPGCCHKNATIKMAKNQGLSLNPTKISGMCGRLMCCLRFENDYYKEFLDAAPKMNAKIKTPDGEGKVVGLDAIKEIVSIKVDDAKPRKIPLSDFSKKKGEEKPTSVGKKAWEDADNTLVDITKSVTNVAIDTSLFSGDDKVAEKGEVKLAEKKESSKSRRDTANSRRKRRRRSSESSNTSTKTASRPGGNSSGLKGRKSSTQRKKKDTEQLKRDKSQERKPRKRRSRTISSN